MQVSVIGAGLAGCEAAWQLAQRGISVPLHEMKQSICALNIVITFLKNKLLFRIYFFQNSCPSHP